MPSSWQGSFLRAETENWLVILGRLLFSFCIVVLALKHNLSFWKDKPLSAFSHCLAIEASCRYATAFRNLSMDEWSTKSVLNGTEALSHEKSCEWRNSFLTMHVANSVSWHTSGEALHTLHSIFLCGPNHFNTGLLCYTVLSVVSFQLPMCQLNLHNNPKKSKCTGLSIEDKTTF